MLNKYAVELRNITKQFPGVLANDNISLQIKQGCVHALVGENGAGKTTLMSILYGLVKPDSGEILLNGEKVAIRSPKHAISMGLGMVHQHFMLVPSYTVAQNIYLGHELTQYGWVNQREAELQVKRLSDQYKLTVEPKSLVRDLPVGVQQRVEILKVLQHGAEIIILDEPTAVLTPQECDELFDVIRALVADGKTVIIITHKLSEVKEISNQVTVLRKGCVIGTVNTNSVSAGELASMMVGSKIPEMESRSQITTGKSVLEVQGLSVLDKYKSEVVKNVSFLVKEGEIVTIAGVEGNGQTELVETITGLRKASQGQISINKKEITNLSPKEVRVAGLAHVPEDRIATGTNVKASISDNLIAGRHRKPPISKRGWIRSEEKEKFSTNLVEKYQIKTPGVSVKAGALSGGNLQKVVASRELSFDKPLLTVVQPTRGLDIASSRFIHETLLEMRDDHKAILLVSTELDEVFKLSDRILVMYEGEIVGEFSPEKINREELGLYMAGVKRQSGLESDQNEE